MDENHSLIEFIAILDSPKSNQRIPMVEKRAIRRFFVDLRGFTLVEILTTIAILGVLIAILLPAIQVAREAGRRTHCQNNLRNIAAALLTHHTTVGAFPSGGWGYEWVGVPRRGSGKSQPGGWIYSILPYLDENALHELGEGSSGATANALFSQRLTTPIKLLVCPTRRPASAWPISDSFAYMRTPKPFGTIERAARTDYAINSGTSLVFIEPGPPSLQDGDNEQFWHDKPQTTGFSGISHLRIAATIAGIADGTTNTYLVGEKHLQSEFYTTGESRGDNASLYSGYCTDLHRFAGTLESLRFGTPPFVAPIYDNARLSRGAPDGKSFGSAHVDGFHMTFCDGSARLVAYDIDVEIHLRSAHRRDRGAPIDRLK